MGTKHSYRQSLNERKLKATENRLALLELMNNYGSAVPHLAIKEGLKGMDRVTLYRNLDELTKHGVIHEAYREHGESYFAICSSSCSSKSHIHDHVHFKCTSCSQVTCEKGSVNLALTNMKYTVQKIKVQVEGICDQCV